MLLAQGRLWRVSRRKGADTIVVSLLRGELSEEQRGLRDLRIEVPLDKWNRVVKHVRSDRKLLGGVMLDFANEKDSLAAALGNDRLFGELQRVLLEASASLVESGALVMTVVEWGGD